MGPEGVLSVAVAICVTMAGCGGVFTAACLARKQCSYPLLSPLLSAPATMGAGLCFFAATAAVYYFMYTGGNAFIEQYPLSAGAGAGAALGAALVCWAISLQHVCLSLFPDRNPYGVVALPDEMESDEGGVRWCNASIVPEQYQVRHLAWLPAC